MCALVSLSSAVFYALKLFYACTIADSQCQLNLNFLLQLAQRVGMKRCLVITVVHLVMSSTIQMYTLSVGGQIC